jgi:hypothetical protein
VGGLLGGHGGLGGVVLLAEGDLLFGVHGLFDCLFSCTLERAAFIFTRGHIMNRLTSLIIL